MRICCWSRQSRGLSLFMNEQGSHNLDTQQVEIVGRNLLTSLLVAEGLEVATPIRDKGIDLIVFNSSNGTFQALPIQLKAASAESFSIYRKYERIPNLLMAYIWHVHDPLNSVVYIMRYKDAVSVAESLGYTNTPSWLDKGGYSSQKPGRELLNVLSKHKYEPGNVADLLSL